MTINAYSGEKVVTFSSDPIYQGSPSYHTAVWIGLSIYGMWSGVASSGADSFYDGWITVGSQNII